jgi:hypothetical protein
MKIAQVWKRQPTHADILRLPLSFCCCQRALLDETYEAYLGVLSKEATSQPSAQT